MQMLGLRIRRLISKAALWKLARTYFAWVGAVVLAVEFINIFTKSGIHMSSAYAIPVLLVLVVISMAIALPPVETHRAVPGLDTVVRVKVGDLLSQSGNIVVGVSDHFDTEVSDGTISPDSVQGQVLGRAFGGDRALLDRLIEENLKTCGVAGEPNQGKCFGKSLRYPIGTVAVVQRDQQRFFFVVYTRMAGTRSVETDIESLTASLCAVWECIRQYGQQEPVHMPIVGTRFARLRMSRNLALQLTAITFLTATSAGRSVAPELTVHVRPEDAKHVDFGAVGSWLESAVKGFS